MNKIKEILTSVQYDKIEAETTDQLLVEITNLMKTEGSFIYIQSDIGITIDKLMDGIDQEFKGIRKIRVFNENSELYLWRISEREFSLRLRTDGDGADSMYYNTDLLVFGNENQVGKENSGREIKLPINANKENVYLKCRNYLEFNEIDQIGIVDYRIIGFDMRGD